MTSKSIDQASSPLFQWLLYVSGLPLIQWSLHYSGWSALDSSDRGSFRFTLDFFDCRVIQVYCVFQVCALFQWSLCHSGLPLVYVDSCIIQVCPRFQWSLSFRSTLDSSNRCVIQVYSWFQWSLYHSGLPSIPVMAVSFRSTLGTSDRCIIQVCPRFQWSLCLSGLYPRFLWPLYV